MYAACDFHLFTEKDFVAKFQVGSTLPFRGKRYIRKADFDSNVNDENIHHFMVIWTTVDKPQSE